MFAIDYNFRFYTFYEKYKKCRLIVYNYEIESLDLWETSLFVSLKLLFLSSVSVHGLFVKHSYIKL